MAGLVGILGWSASEAGGAIVGRKSDERYHMTQEGTDYLIDEALRRQASGDEAGVQRLFDLGMEVLPGRDVNRLDYLLNPDLYAIEIEED